MRVNSENQTLILAGEPLPRRSLTESNARGFAFAASPSRRPLTLVATPVDEPILIGQSGSEDLSAELTVLPRNRGSVYSGADAYARTQQLAAGSARSAIIDTYA